MAMAHSVSEIDVALPHAALPAGDWADAYRVTIATPFQTARSAGEAAFSTFPFWVNALMALRNLIVTPFGLKTGAAEKPVTARIGFFPVISEADEQVVVGMNDRHLDFRCVIDITDRDAGPQGVTIATIIKRHNWLGRTYLATIMPFHRLIVRTALARLARANEN